MSVLFCIMKIGTVLIRGSDVFLFRFRVLLYCVAFSLTFLFLTGGAEVYAHPGRTAGDGCHYCRTNCSSWGVSYGQRHCHQNKGVPQPSIPIRSHRDGTVEVWEPYMLPKYTSTPSFSTGSRQNTRLCVGGERGIGSGSVKFFRSLRIGSFGEDVYRLQSFLNAEGFTVSVYGAGSVGNETCYFGPKTRQALIRYQNFYRSDILTPLGLYSGTGYFGPMTMFHVNNRLN